MVTAQTRILAHEIGKQLSDNPQMQVLIANAISNAVAIGTGAATDLALGGSGINGAGIASALQQYNQSHNPNDKKMDTTTQAVMDNLYEWAMNTIEAASYFPGIGEPASAALAIIYAAQGDYKNALINLSAVGIGLAAGGMGKWFTKGGELATEEAEKAYKEYMAGNHSNSYHTENIFNDGGVAGDLKVQVVYDKTTGKAKAAEDVISPSSELSQEMEEKILYGQRIDGSNRVIGGHSSAIDNVDSKYAVDEIKTNEDGTRTVKYTTQFEDGSLSKIKTSTLFPKSWSDESIIDAIKKVGNSSPIGQRLSTGETLHREVVNGVEIDVVKKGNEIISGYPVGGKPTEGFIKTK